MTVDGLPKGTKPAARVVRAAGVGPARRRGSRFAVASVCAVLACAAPGALAAKPTVAGSAGHAAPGDAPTTEETAAKGEVISAMLITGARVLAEDAAGWREGVAVLVRGATIEQVAPQSKLQAQVPAEVPRVAADGLYLLPGLMDLHTHLLLHPYDETPWNDQVLKEPLELRTIRAVNAARATLEAGFTTIRDLGTEGAGFADVALRSAVASGMIAGPRILAATRAIVATGCYGPSGFDPRWPVPKGAQEADGVDGVRKAVREQIAAGADWVKFYADYRRTPSGDATPSFSLPEMQAMVDEARSAGLPVAAHATTDEGIRRAVLAGVATIEHGNGASTAVLQLMREHGVVLCPTLAASEALARYAGWKPGDAEPARLRQSREMFARALQAGVKLACGSDAGVFAHGANARELELMVEGGLPRAEALRAATVDAAAVIGRAKDLGRVAPGFVADLIATRNDPLQDIAALRGPVLVIKDGHSVVDRR